MGDTRSFLERHRKGITLGILVTLLAPEITRAVKKVVADYKTYKEIVDEMDTYCIEQVSAQYEAREVQRETSTGAIPDVPSRPRSHFLRKGPGYHHVNNDYNPGKAALHQKSV